MKKFLDDIGLSYFWDKIKTYVDNKAISASVDLNLLYPIGRGFIDFTDTDYSNWLGFTWERELVGMFPIGYNPDDTDFNTIGKTGGEKTHTLTLNELPKYSKSVSWQQSSKEASGWGLVSNGGFLNRVVVTGGSTNTASFGNNQSHNNLPPFQVVAYWKRVA